MADLVLSVAQTLFAAIECTELKEIFYISGYKSQLADLKNTVETIRKVLLDAEAKQELSSTAQGWVENLKDAVYDADDLFDELLTLADLKELKRGAKISRKVRDFFTSRNPLKVAYTMSKEVKRIRKKLDTFADNHRKFGFGVDYQPIRRKREETCSYVYANDIIGREGELKEVVDMLLVSDCKEDISFLTIVGVGGLGKTTLAQLMYEDERVKSQFSLRLWACVSDQDGKQFDVKYILCKILESATREKYDIDCSMELVQTKLREVLEGNRFVLVLDDLWNEDPHEWSKLRIFLMRGSRGSRVVTTTRSKLTAKVIGEKYTYDLKGLSDENSWHLFELTAFDKDSEAAIISELVNIGKNIVKKCVNVPLAIKVVGSLLYGQEKSKWKLVEENGLANIGRGENHIMLILKLSYYNLESPLKSCFSYCALFPKDFEIKKDMLVNLWIAQGYVLPFDVGQSTEDAGEEYFSVLLRRCFFHDVKMDEYGEVLSCKIHDLMHDVAQEVAGKEICVTADTNNLGDKGRHLFHLGKNISESSYSESKIRSYVQDLWDFSLFPVEVLVSNLTCLRTLDMHNLGIEALPYSIGKLIHLRYLDLSGNNDLRVLPNSISKLQNLHTLNLDGCYKITELPKTFSQLKKLTNLYLHWDKLSYMPSGFNKMTCLRRLTTYVVSDVNSVANNSVSHLKDLKILVNLKGFLHILIHGNCAVVGEDDSGGGYLRGLEILGAVCIDFQSCNNVCINDDRARNRVALLAKHHEDLLAKLEPHPNLKGLMLWGYHGATLPRWEREDNLATFLPNLIKIQLKTCQGLQHIPMLSKLCHLKSLEIHYSTELEYIENPSSSASGSNVAQATFFPSLEYLNIGGMFKLKGWWRGVGTSDGTGNWQLSFPRLSKLSIWDCPCLVYFPACPNVETILLKKSNENLRISCRKSDFESAASSSSSAPALPPATPNSLPRLREVDIDNILALTSLPVSSITRIQVSSDEKLVDFSGIEDVFIRCSSLRSFTIFNCPNIRSLSGGMEHLTALDYLSLWSNPKLILSNQNNDNDMPWRALHLNLRSLELLHLDSVEILPKGMQHLTALQKLSVGCRNVEALPEWVGSLSSLQSLTIKFGQRLTSMPDAMRKLNYLQQLEISGCENLEKSCLPNGNDWPKISHIPSISIATNHHKRLFFR